MSRREASGGRLTRGLPLKYVGDASGRGLSQNHAGMLFRTPRAGHDGTIPSAYVPPPTSRPQPQRTADWHASPSAPPVGDVARRMHQPGSTHGAREHHARMHVVCPAVRRLTSKRGSPK